MGLTLFSRDGKTVVTILEDAVELYDWPLRSPWGAIAGIALGGATAVFGVGQLLRWRQRRKPVSSARGDQKP